MGGELLRDPAFAPCLLDLRVHLSGTGGKAASSCALPWWEPPNARSAAQVLAREAWANRMTSAFCARTQFCG